MGGVHIINGDGVGRAIAIVIFQLNLERRRVDTGRARGNRKTKITAIDKISKGARKSIVGSRHCDTSPGHWR